MAIENEWLVVRRRLLDILLNLLFDIPRTLDKQIDGIEKIIIDVAAILIPANAHQEWQVIKCADGARR